jgi:hypothetical protein
LARGRSKNHIDISANHTFRFKIKAALGIYSDDLRRELSSSFPIGVENYKSKIAISSRGERTSFPSVTGA